MGMLSLVFLQHRIFIRSAYSLIKYVHRCCFHALVIIQLTELGHIINALDLEGSGQLNLCISSFVRVGDGMSFSH